MCWNDSRSRMGSCHYEREMPSTAGGYREFHISPPSLFLCFNISPLFFLCFTISALFFFVSLPHATFPLFHNNINLFFCFKLSQDCKFSVIRYHLSEYSNSFILWYWQTEIFSIINYRYLTVLLLPNEEKFFEAELWIINSQWLIINPHLVKRWYWQENN